MKANSRSWLAAILLFSLFGAALLSLFLSPSLSPSLFPSLFPLQAHAQAAEPAPGLTGTLVVLNKSGHDASFVDLSSGELLKTLPTGRGPHELIITEDGRWAIGTDYSGGDSLTVFDVSSLEVVRSIDFSQYPRPHGILLMPGDNEVVVTSEASRKLVIVNFHTGELVRTIDTGQRGSHMVALSADGTRAFTSNGQDNSVSVIDVTAGNVIRLLDVPDRPEAITTNSAGTEVWVGSNSNNVVSVISADDGVILSQWDGFSWPYRILLSSDEQFAIIPDLDNQTIRFFDIPTRQELDQIELPGARPEGVILYPDDRTLFVSLSGRDTVLAIDIQSREVLGEYNVGSAPDGIGYSPLVPAR